MVVGAHRSTILDEHKFGEGCERFIRGYAAISDYPIVCCFVGNGRRHLVVELCLSDSKERPRSGLAQQYDNGCSWSHWRDGTYTWVKWSASNDSCYGSIGWVFRLMRSVVALEEYGDSLDIYSGTQIVGTLDAGVVETRDFTVVSGMGPEVVPSTLAVSELMVALLVAWLLAVLVWLSDECVLIVCWSCWDCLLVLCSFGFDVENGARKDHQKHHHSEHYYACLKPVPIWSLLSLCSRQPYCYFRAYSCFELNESTGFLLSEPAGVSYAIFIALYLHIYCFLGCLRGEYVPRLPQRGLSEGVKAVAKAAAALVKQRAVLVKFLSPGSCGSKTLQEVPGLTFFTKLVNLKGKKPTTGYNPGGDQRII